MAEGNDTFKGLGVPLNGNFEIKGISATEDIMTLTAPSGGAGDFIVAQRSTGTEVFVVDVDGALTFKGGTATTGTLDLSGGCDLIIQLEQFTTAPTTGLTAGQLIHYTAGNAHYLGIATAAGTLVEVLLN